jgi:hydrogenase nickel incorporation protein HypA/HybF
MHELAIAQQLIDTATAAMPPDDNIRLVALQVQLGPLAGVSSAELAFGFDVVAAGTPFAGVRLEIEDVPVVVYCAQCQAEFPLDTPVFPLVCPVCGTMAVRIVRGKELTLKSFEVSDDAASA